MCMVDRLSGGGGGGVFINMIGPAVHNKLYKLLMFNKILTKFSSQL